MTGFGKHLAASTIMAAVRPGPGLVAVGLVAWLVINAAVADRLVTDPDDSPPLVGRITAGLMIGVPLALAELAVAGAIWWAITTT